MSVKDVGKPRRSSVPPSQETPAPTSMTAIHGSAPTASSIARENDGKDSNQLTSAASFSA
jgi:hypothetical protein